MEHSDQLGWIENQRGTPPVPQDSHGATSAWSRCVTLLGYTALLLPVAVVAYCLTFPDSVAGVRDDGNRRYAKSQIAALEQQLRLYYLDLGHYPTGQQGLEALRTLPTGLSNPGRWRGPYSEKDIPADPWGTPYRYRVIDNQPIISSAGPDRRFRTSDDVITSNQGNKGTN